MNKIKTAIFGILLGCVSLSSFASGKQCQLSEWCPLQRASDYADIIIYPSDGKIYTCTVSVDGEQHLGRWVYANFSGHNGFEMESGTLGVPQGVAYTQRIQGTFTDVHGDPIIRIRRMAGGIDGTNAMAYVMCESGTYKK